MRREHLDAARAVARRPAGEALEHDASEGVDVGGGGEVLGAVCSGQMQDSEPPAKPVRVRALASVYIRRSGFTDVGVVSYVWKHDGRTVASGTNTSTVDGPFRHGLTGSPLSNGVYEITWTYGGATIGTATVTRAC